MDYRVATLIWLLLTAGTLITFLVTIAIGGAVLENDHFEFRHLFFVVGLVFLVIILGWGSWAVFPMTGIALS